MSREIKFRAWDKEHQRMIPLGGNRYLDMSDEGKYKIVFGDDFHDDYHGETIYPEGFEIMQFADYKDKNGRDIYDGDYLASAWGKYRVYWDRGGFVIQSEDGIRSNIGDIDVSTLEIVGNRCENPEFLPFFSFWLEEQ
jgi:hypothetical protein